MPKPLVSIVTPSYQQADYLEATIQSVLNQEKVEIEYLIVDGGSRDGSREIIKTYEDALAWWVSEPDRGQADAINKGFRRSSGEILAWLNSDDLYLPKAVQHAVKVLDADPELGMVFGNAVSADQSGRLINYLRFGDRNLEDFLRFKMICQPAVFMRREIVEMVGYLDSSYEFLLDHHLWIRIARKTKIRHVDETWAVSRYHPEAKNVYLAEKCGEEAYRILKWAKTKPDLAPLIAKHGRKIWGGAHQLNARYLLDSEKNHEAFLHYIKAVRSWPPLFKESWKRIIFSGLSLLGFGFLRDWYNFWQRKSRPKLPKIKDNQKWPGLHQDS